MKSENFEDIYNSSITAIVKKFIDSPNDFFLTEKDLHFYFFHSCLNINRFEYNDKLLIHTEYPMPFLATTEDKNSLIKIVEDDEKKRRPRTDSILFNKNFIDWASKLKEEDIPEKKYKDYVADCIRGLCINTDSFLDYINDFRGTYEKFNKEYDESILSHSLEFKFIRGGVEGVKKTIDDIKYDLKKLELIGELNKYFNFPFSKKCTLLIFIGKRELVKERRNVGIVEELNNLEDKYKKLLKKFSRTKPEYSDDMERCVIRYDLKK